MPDEPTYILTAFHSTPRKITLHSDKPWTEDGMKEWILENADKVREGDNFIEAENYDGVNPSTCILLWLTRYANNIHVHRTEHIGILHIDETRDEP